MNENSNYYQQGSALMVCLMVLAIITLLGASAILNTGMETKITHNNRKSEEAFYAAEAGIEHILSRHDLKTIKENDVITSEALRKSDSAYGPRYQVTMLAVEQFDWGVTVCTIESVGYARTMETRRVLRASIKIVDETAQTNKFEMEYPHA